MKLFWITALTAGALTLSSAGQTGGAANSGQPGQDSSVLNGTDVVAELSKSVNVKKVKLGDPVKATVTQDVLAHGKILIRRGSKLVGHVTQAKVRSHDDQESRLGFVFDKALLKGGGEMDFSAVVRALAPGVRIGAVDKPDQMPPPLTANMIGGSAGSQPISSTSSSRGMGGGNASSSGVVATDPATRAAVYSAAASGKPGHQEPDLMGAGSRGVFGLPDLKLNREPAGGQGSVISSMRHNVKLDSGTQMVLQLSSPQTR